MKKIILTIALFLLCSSSVFGDSIGMRNDIPSSGLLTSSQQVTSEAATIYSITGFAGSSPSVIYLCNGDEGDSANDANVFIALSAPSANFAMCYTVPNGVRFPNGIYFREVTGDSNITVIYQ